MPYEWETDAGHPAEYHLVEAQRGREFILRLTTGSDVFLALQQFARDHDICFAKIHAAFMGGLQPTRFLVWAPDTGDPDNWHNEEPRTVHNLTMVLAMSGMIHPRPVRGGGDEPFPVIHFVVGGAWDAPTAGRHLPEGSIVKGVLEIFITEITGIEVIHPEAAVKDPHAEQFPDNWYVETEKNAGRDSKMVLNHHRLTASNEEVLPFAVQMAAEKTELERIAAWLQAHSATA